MFVIEKPQCDLLSILTDAKLSRCHSKITPKNDSTCGKSGSLLDQKLACFEFNLMFLYRFYPKF